MIENLIDSKGRRLSKLRLNLLDACNMRCLYCMPEDQVFKKTKDLLSPMEISRIVSNLVQYGVDEVRLTGGEPLLHPHFKVIVQELNKLKLKKLALTTNAILLKKYLPFLKENNVNHINISLDSLDKNSFINITKSKKFDEVLESINLANEMGFKIKINVVVLRQLNFKEVENFLDFSSRTGIEVRFLELMKIGQALAYFDKQFVAADEIIEVISKKWELKKESRPLDSTSFNFTATSENKTAKIGFIASESKPFCQGCSRLRLSNQGILRPCLMINEGPNLNSISKDEYKVTLQELIEQKPTTRLEGNNLKMNEIGG